MKEKEKQIINVCLNDNKTQKYYSNIIKKRYKYTLHLLSKARVAYMENTNVDLPITSKNYSLETIQKKLLKKDYSVPDNFISLLDHLLVLNLTYKMLADKGILSVKERIDIFFAVDRVLHLLVEKVSWYTGYYQALFIDKRALSKLQQKGRAKTTSKRKQDCIEAYHRIPLSDRSTLSPNCIAEKTIPKILIKNYGYTSIEKAQEMKKNGLPKKKKIVPSINSILGYIKDELPPERTNQ